MKPKFKFADRMLYQPNTFGYWLVMLSLIASIIALFTIINYDSFDPIVDALRVDPDMRIGLEIGFGIITLLLTFLAAEKVKNYSIGWSAGLLLLAAFDFWRMDKIALYVGEQLWVPETVLARACYEFAVAGGLLVSAAVISLFKSIVIVMHRREMNRHGAVVAPERQ